MNKLGLYLRLAARNLFKNRQYYGPFFLTAAGCAAMKEWLATGPEGAPAMTLGDVPNLWRCLARIQKDEHNPDVYAKTPHDLTHDVDSLRYFCVWWKNPAAPGAKAERAVWEPDLYEDYENADEEGKAYLLRRYGDPWG